MTQVWLKTTSALVRADTIVEAAVTGNQLVVRLGITSGGADPIAGWAVGLQERTVCEVSPNDKRPSARDLVEYIAWIRSRGEAGVVVISEHGDLGLDTFNDLPI